MIDARLIGPTEGRCIHDMLEPQCSLCRGLSESHLQKTATQFFNCPSCGELVKPGDFLGKKLVPDRTTGVKRWRLVGECCADDSH